MSRWWGTDNFLEIHTFICIWYVNKGALEVLFGGFLFFHLFSLWSVSQFHCAELYRLLALATLPYRRESGVNSLAYLSGDQKKKTSVFPE